MTVMGHLAATALGSSDGQGRFNNALQNDVRRTPSRHHARDCRASVPSCRRPAIPAWRMWTARAARHSAASAPGSRLCSWLLLAQACRLQVRGAPRHARGLLAAEVRGKRSERRCSADASHCHGLDTADDLGVRDSIRTCGGQPRLADLECSAVQDIYSGPTVMSGKRWFATVLTRPLTHPDLAPENRTTKPKPKMHSWSTKDALPRVPAHGIICPRVHRQSGPIRAAWVTAKQGLTVEPMPGSNCLRPQRTAPDTETGPAASSLSTARSVRRAGPARLPLFRPA